MVLLSSSSGESVEVGQNPPGIALPLCWMPQVGQAGQGSVEPTWSAEAEMSEAKIRLRWLCCAPPYRSSPCGSAPSCHACHPYAVQRTKSQLIIS